MNSKIEVEYDPEKRLKTLNERGLDFESAREVFSGPVLSRIDDRADYGKPRIITAGFLRDRLVIMVWTWRGERRRIISMRHANDREQKALAPYLD